MNFLSLVQIGCRTMRTPMTKFLRASYSAREKKANPQFSKEKGPAGQRDLFQITLVQRMKPIPA